MVWLAVKRPTISLTSAYFSGTTSNTSPAAASVCAARLGCPASGLALAAPTPVIETEIARPANPLAAIWMGAFPEMVRVRMLSFWVKVMDWTSPCLPPGKARFGVSLVSAKAMTAVLASLPIMENCGINWLNDRITRDSEGVGSEGVTAVIRVVPEACGMPSALATDRRPPGAARATSAIRTADRLRRSVIKDPSNRH